MTLTGFSIRHRIANWLVDELADHGYWPDQQPLDAQMRYHGLRHEVYKIVKANPGLRCYQVEHKLRINTPKQRVTNSILRDLEEDRLIVAIPDTAKGPRRYYDYLDLL